MFCVFFYRFSLFYFFLLIFQFVFVSISFPAFFFLVFCFFYFPCFFLCACLAFYTAAGHPAQGSELRHPGVSQAASTVMNECCGERLVKVMGSIGDMKVCLESASSQAWLGTSQILTSWRMPEPILRNVTSCNSWTPLRSQISAREPLHRSGGCGHLMGLEAHVWGRQVQAGGSLQPNIFTNHNKTLGLGLKTSTLGLRGARDSWP